MVYNVWLGDKGRQLVQSLADLLLLVSGLEVDQDVAGVRAEVYFKLNEAVEFMI